MNGKFCIKQWQECKGGCFFIGIIYMVSIKNIRPYLPATLIYVAAICPAVYRCSKKRFTTCSPVSVCTFSQYTPLLSVVGISSACTPAAVRLVACTN